jgi:hypothetical protein
LKLAAFFCNTEDTKLDVQYLKSQSQSKCYEFCNANHVHIG